MRRAFSASQPYPNAVPDPKPRPTSHRRNHLAAAGVRILLVAFGLAMGLVLAIGLDRAYGAMRRVGPRSTPVVPSGLIFTPGERVRHITPEFDYVATINAMGFRGTEPQDSSLRIMAIGDSWVYGWGVSDTATWVALLEDSLEARLREPRIEILNLGAPGMSPSGFATIAERVIPALRPKLVLVGVLQGQDFAQLWWETQTPSERASTISGRELTALAAGKVRRTVTRVFPNFAALLSSRARSVRAETQEQEEAPTDSALAANSRAGLRAQAAEIERTLSREGRRRFEALPLEMRESFRRGDFNPSLLYYALRQPDYFALTTQLETARGKEVVSELTHHLGRVRKAADRVGATTVVLSMPYGAYVSADVCAAHRAVGYRCGDDLLTTGDADTAIRMAARAAGIPDVIEVTERFRSESRSGPSPLFYRVDGHLTAHGNLVYARLLAPHVSERAARALGLSSGLTEAPRASPSD